LLEGYVENLFGEIIHNYGAGPYYHVAFLRDEGDKQRHDPTFLQTRLRILPVFYEDHGSLPEYLGQLRTLVEPPVQPVRPEAIAQPPPTTVHQDKLGFTVPTNASGSDLAKVRVELHNAHLPFPDHDPVTHREGSWKGYKRPVVTRFGRLVLSLYPKTNQKRSSLEKVVVGPAVI
jgi:hypothetical protein